MTPISLFDIPPVSSDIRRRSTRIAVAGVEHGGLLAALDDPRHGLRVVRQCNDAVELIAVGMAGEVELVVVDTSVADIDRTVIDRLCRAGLSGVLLTDPGGEQWRRTGWPVLDNRSPVVSVVDCVMAVAQRMRSGRPIGLETGPEPSSGSLVVVWGTHGAPGRSTIATSLAYGLSRCGGSVLIDADVEAPSLVHTLHGALEPGSIATAARLAVHARLDQKMMQDLLVTLGPHHRMLSGVGGAGRWRELPACVMTDVWDYSCRLAPWTVVDVAGGPVKDETVDDFSFEPGPGALMASLLSYADVIVVVGRADPVGLHRLVHLLEELGARQDVTGRVEIVINRVQCGVPCQRTQDVVRRALAGCGHLADPLYLPDDHKAAAALLRGRSVLEHDGRSDLGQGLADLVRRVAQMGEPYSPPRRPASRWYQAVVGRLRRCSFSSRMR